VTDEKEFQEKIRQLGSLVGELDPLPGSGAKVAAREVVQLLMEVHGAGLERMLELVFASGAEGEPIIGKFGQDPIVRSLLLLYSLHPDDLETRVVQALERVGPRLRKLDAEVYLVSVHEGAVELSLHTSSHSCGSTARNLQSIVEESVYEFAPDLASLSISVLENRPASGFVPLESLLAHRFAGLSVSGGEASGDD
jgi:Fe-S cluster biogenesis protein NfuA